jgi:hypothetical protein
MSHWLSTNTPKKATAALLAGVLVFTTIGDSLAQTNFWSDRQAARGAAAGSGFSDENQRQLRSIPWPKDALNPVLGAYRLPAVLGAVIETVPAPQADAPLVLHIQDAHGLYGAQFNASKILEGLRKAGWSGRDGLTVFQEGGAGEAPVDWLAAFPDSDVKERVARAYLRRGDITGEEYRAVVASSGAFRLIGAETNDLYKRNLAARHDTAAARAAADAAITGFQTRLAALKERLYPAPLRAIDKAVDAYANQRHSFIEYMAALEKAAPKDVRWEKYPNLDRLRRITALESQMDLRAVADERDLAVRKMAAHIGAGDLRRLTDRAVEVRGGVLTPARFYEEFLTLADRLRREGQDMPTQALRNYVGYLKLSETLKHDELMAEAEQLRARLLERYSSDDRLWRMVQTDRRVSLERLLWKQEMSPDQYAAFRREGPLDWPEVDRYLAAQEASLRLSVGAARDLGWTESLPSVRAFYELALDRDIALVKNTLADLKGRGESRGVLIAGGFHTPGLTRLLRQSGAGYVVVQPRFEADEPRRAEDLKISKDLAALGASATAREMNRLGAGTLALPLGENTPAQMGSAATGLAMTAALSLGEKSRAYLETLRAWLKGSASRLGLEIYSAHQLNTPEAKDLIVLYGRARGENFVFAFREGDAERGDRVSLMIGERELDGTGQVNLAKRLPGVVEGRGLLQWMRDTLGQIKGRTDTAEIQKTIRTGAPGYLTDVLALASTAATAANQPILENSREGQALMNAAVKAVGAATQRAPSRLSGWLAGAAGRAAAGVGIARGIASRALSWKAGNATGLKRWATVAGATVLASLGALVLSGDFFYPIFAVAFVAPVSLLAGRLKNPASPLGRFLKYSPLGVVVAWTAVSVGALPAAATLGMAAAVSVGTVVLVRVLSKMNLPSPALRTLLAGLVFLGVVSPAFAAPFATDAVVSGAQAESTLSGDVVTSTYTGSLVAVGAVLAAALAVYGVSRLRGRLARTSPAVTSAPAGPTAEDAPAPARRFSLGGFWIPLAVTVASYAGLVAFGFPAATEVLQTFIASPALPAVTKIMLNVLVYGTEFLSQVTLLLTGLVIAARAVGPTAGGVFGRAVRALRPNTEGLDSTKGLLAQTGERSAVNRQTVREIVRARGVAAGFTAAFWRAVAFVAGDVWRTFYGFAFQKSDNLYLIWSGRGESVRGPPSLLEESFISTDALLQKWGARPVFRRTATLLLLPLYATLGIFGKRLAVLAYSTLGQFALMTTLSWTLSAAVVPGGKMVLVAGLAVLGAAAFLRSGGPDVPARARWIQRSVRSMIFLLPAAAIAFLVPAGGDALGLTAAVVHFNPLDLLMGTGWSAGFGHTGVGAAAVALAAPFVMASSYATSAVMRWVSGAQRLNLSALAERENLTQTKASRWARALGWVPRMKASLLEPVHALPYQDADGGPVLGSLWRAAFHTAFAPRTLGFGGLHTVGLEIEAAKWVAHLLGGSLGGLGRFFEHLIVKAEGDGGRASVLAAGGQLLDRVGAGANVAGAAADFLLPSARAADVSATGKTGEPAVVEPAVSEPVVDKAVPAAGPALDVAQVATRGSSLNVRASPGRDAPYAGALKPNESPVMIYEYAAVTGAAGTEQWARVGADRWVDARYLKIAPRSEEGIVDYATVQTQTRPLTVRAAPGVEKTAVGALPKGSPVGVLQYASVITERGEEKWAKIGANRWVSAQYLSVHSAGPAATPAPAPAVPTTAVAVPAAPALENLAQTAAEILPSLAAVPDPSLTVALPIEGGVDRPAPETVTVENVATAAVAPGVLTQWAERAASVFTPMGAAAHHWMAGLSLADWAMPLFTSFGVFGALHFWRRNPTPQDFSNWAAGVADRMLHELTQGPRTYPKTWGAAFLRWRRNQLSATDQSRVDAAPAWRRWFLRSALLLQRGQVPRYNTHGSHGRYISFIGLADVKKSVTRLEIGDPELKSLLGQLAVVDRAVARLVHDRKTVDDAAKRSELAELNRRRDELDQKILDRRLALQTQFMEPLRRALAERRDRALGDAADAMREQREVMWRTFENTYTFYGERLIPEGFRLQFRSRLFLSLAVVGRLTFTGLFLSQVFFFPSPILTAASWVVLGPLLFNISRSFVDPLLVMVFMMFGPPPKGHARRDFLEVVRDHAKAAGRPYAFSVEVPKMSGNPMDGFLKTDIAEEFLKPTEAEKKGISTKFDLTPGAPRAELRLPRILSVEEQQQFEEFARGRLWDGFRLDVSVEFEPVIEQDQQVGTRAVFRPSPGPGARFRARVDEVLAKAKGPAQRLAPGGVEILHDEWIVIESLEDYVSPIGPGMYPAETEGVSTAEEKAWSNLGRMIEDEYGLPISLYFDRAPNVSVRFDNVDGRVVRRVTYRFSVPRQNRPEIAQNVDMMTRFHDTIHLEADVWAAYRRVDIENIRQTLRDTAAEEFSLSFAMPSNTNNPMLIQYELENLQKLQSELDAEFPGRVSFVYFNQAIEWASGLETKWREALAAADPVKALGDRFTVFGKDGSRDYFTVQGANVLHARTAADGRRSLATMTRAEAIERLKGVDAETVDAVVRWGRGGWGKKLGNVAGLEWIKAGHTRPPAYTNIRAHEHFTNPDAPIFPNASQLAGDILGYFRNEVLVHRVDGTTVLYKAELSSDVVQVTENGQSRTVNRAEANKALAAAIADFGTDRLSDAEGRPLEPDDLSVVMDDKNSILPGAVEAAIGVAEHPANKGVVGFNPAIEVDAPRNTRGGLAGVYFASILLDYLDKSRLIHNQYDARFKADLFGNLSAMYGKIFKRASYGDSFTDERVTVARALSHDWQESQFSPTEAVYGDVAHTFQLMSRTQDRETKQAFQTYRMRLGGRHDLLRLVMTPAASGNGAISVEVQRINEQGEWAAWRTFEAAADEGPKPVVQRIAAYLTNAIGVRERDLLTLAGVVDRDFRWLRGDLQMQATAKAYARDALPHAHRYHLGGIDFRLNGDPSFLVVLAALVPLWIFMDQAILTNETLAYVLFGITMLGVAFRGHFLYPAYYDAISRVRIITTSPAVGKLLFAGLLVVFGVKNFLLSLLTISATTLMSLPIAIKRTFYLERVAKVIEFVKNVPSVWVTSSATVVREMLGVKIGDTWRSEISMMNLVLFGTLSLAAFAGLIYSGNIYFGALWPLGISILVASMLTGWLVAHFAGQAYRRDDKNAMRWRWLQVYGLSALIAGVIFFSPVTTFLTDSKIQALRTPPAAELVLKQLADPVTKPRPYAGVDISGGLALQVQRTEPIAQEAAPKILQAATNVGAGIKAEVFPGIESLRLTGIPKLDLPLPGDVKTSPYTTAQFEPPEPLGMLKKPQLTEEQTKKLAYLLSQLDLMNTDLVKWENVGIYGGATALITLEPHAAVALKIVDVGTYLNMLSKGYPWLREPMVAKYWAQTALLMDINATFGDTATTQQSQVRTVDEIAQLLLWDKIKTLWNHDFTAHVQKGQTMKHPKNETVLITEQDYRELAEKATDSLDKYEVLSTAVINLHYGLGYPLEKITPDLVWRFTRLSYEIERAWEVVVPSVDVRPVQLFPKPAAKFLRVMGNITFVLPVRIPFLSDAHLEMIPMVTAFYQEPGGLQEFLTQMLEHNQKSVTDPASADYMKTFLERIGADYIQQYSDAQKHPADAALYNLVKDRMTEDLKKFNKTPSEKDLRLAYLQTEYNLGRIALFNRTKVQSKDMGEIRAAALSVARELATVQSLAQSLAPTLYTTHMKMEPGVLEVEGIMLYLLEGQPERKAEYLRVFRDVLKTSESIAGDMARRGWKIADAYTQHVLSLLPPALVADMTPKAQEYNVLRDLAMLHLNIQKNDIVKANRAPYTYQETMRALLEVRARVKDLRVPEKPGILATLLLHSLKMKTLHPEVTEKAYWEENVIPTLRYWAAWSASPQIMSALDASPAWDWYRTKINAEIEKEMGAPIQDAEVRQFNAAQSMAQLVDGIYSAFPKLKKEHAGKPRRVADLMITLAERARAYDALFDSLGELPSDAVGFREYYVVAGYELNGMAKKFDPKAGFAKEVEGFVLRPINDLWNAGVYESLPESFIEAIRARMKDTQEQLGIGEREIKPMDLKIQVLQAFYKMATSAIFSADAPAPLPAYSPAFLKTVTAVGRELIGYTHLIGQQTRGLPRVHNYVLKEPGILENEAIQIFLLKKRGGGNFNQANYVAHTRLIFQKIDTILRDRPGILRTDVFGNYRGVKSGLLSPQANERMTERGRDFLALRSLANLVVNAEHNDMRPGKPLAARGLSPEGWMAAYLDAWDHFENAPKYGGRQYQHVPYREEGFVDMVTLLKQKWGFGKFWESYYYERLNQVERFMSDPAFVKFIRTAGGAGEKMLWVINDDIFRKSGIRFAPDHPIFTFNGVIGLTEMFIDAGKKFPGAEINYQLLAARYLRYYDLFYTVNPATGKTRFPHLPYQEEGFIESLVTGGYNFESNGGRFEDELRIMKLRDVDALMGAKFLDLDEKLGDIFVRGYLEGIIRSESTVPPGVSMPVIDFFILQKIVGLGQTYNMLTGPSAGPGQPSSVDLAADVPVLKTAARALVHVHHGVRQKAADGKDLYPKLRPIFEILGESEKWVGRMRATGLMEESRFPEVFTNYIDVLERHYDELKGTYLQPEQGPAGGRYLGELGTYLRVLKENLRKDAAAIEARFVTRDQRDRRFGLGAELEDEKAGAAEDEKRAQIVFVRPEIDESQFILDAGYIMTEIVRDMNNEIAAAGAPALKGVTVDGLLSHYFKTLKYLKTGQYKDDIVRVQSYRDSESLGRLNGKINNYAMRFAFIDYLAFSPQADARLNEFFTGNGLASVEQFVDRFYANLKTVQSTEGLRQALDELRNANEYSAEGVEFSYAMMLTLNHRISPETLQRVAGRIPDILRDYNDFLLRGGEGGTALKFRVDSAVVLYEALARELAAARPLGETGDRIEVKQKRTNAPWMTNTIVKAVYGNLFGVYLDEENPDHAKFLKEWERKAFGQDLKSVVQELAAQEQVFGQKNPYLDEVAKVDRAIQDLTVKMETARRDLRESLAEDYQTQIRILQQIRAGLEERLGYLIQLGESLDQTYAQGVSEKNQAAFEMLLLLSLAGFGVGLWGLARRGRLPARDGLSGMARLRADLEELNKRREGIPALSNAALALYLGLPVAYGLIFGVGFAPRLYQDTQAVLSKAPYVFEAPAATRDRVFQGEGFEVRQTEEKRGGRPVVEHKIMSGGYLIGRIEVSTGYAEFVPGAIPGTAGVTYPLSPGPSLVLMGYGETTAVGKKVYRYGAEMTNVNYRVDETGRLVLSASLRDTAGAFTTKDFQMAIGVAPGNTRVTVSGQFGARRDVSLSEFNIGSLNSQSYIGKPKGPPSPSDRSLFVEAVGFTGDRYYSYFGNEQTLPANGLTTWNVRTVSLGGTAYNNTPNVKLTPDTVTLTDPAGRVTRVAPVATYTLLPQQSTARDNIAIAPVVGGATDLSIRAGGAIQLRYTVEYTPVQLKEDGTPAAINGAAAQPAAPTPAPGAGSQAAPAAPPAASAPPVGAAWTRGFLAFAPTALVLLGSLVLGALAVVWFRRGPKAPTSGTPNRFVRWGRGLLAALGLGRASAETTAIENRTEPALENGPAADADDDFDIDVNLADWNAEPALDDVDVAIPGLELDETPGEDLDFDFSALADGENWEDVSVVIDMALMSGAGSLVVWDYRSKRAERVSLGDSPVSLGPTAPLDIANDASGFPKFGLGVEVLSEGPVRGFVVRAPANTNDLSAVLRAVLEALGDREATVIGQSDSTGVSVAVLPTVRPLATGARALDESLLLAGVPGVLTPVDMEQQRAALTMSARDFETLRRDVVGWLNALPSTSDRLNNVFADDAAAGRIPVARLAAMETRRDGVFAAVLNPARATASPENYPNDPLNPDRLAADRARLRLDDRLIRSNDNPPLPGALLDVSEEAFEAQEWTPRGARHFVSLLRQAPGHLVFRNEGRTPEASGASVLDRDHNQLVPRAVVNTLTGGTLAVETAPRALLWQQGPVKVEELQGGWHGFVVTSDATGAGLERGMELVSRSLNLGSYGQGLRGSVAGAALIGTRTADGYAIYVLPRRADGHAQTGALEMAGLFVLRSAEDYAGWNAENAMDRVRQVSVSEREWSVYLRRFHGQAMVEGRDFPGRGRWNAFFIGLSVLALLLVSGDVAAASVAAGNPVLAAGSMGVLPLASLALLAVVALRSRIASVRAAVTTARSRSVSTVRAAVGLVARSTEKLLQNVVNRPVAIALAFAALFALVGVPAAAASVGAAETGAVAGSALPLLAGMTVAALTGAGLSAVLSLPGVPDVRSTWDLFKRAPREGPENGIAWVVDLPRNQFDPEVGVRLLSEIRGAAQDAAGRDHSLTLAMPNPPVSETERAALIQAFREQAAGLEGLSASFVDRLQISIVARQETILRNRLAQLAGSHRLVVVAPAAEGDFWRNLGFAEVLYLVNALLNVASDVVLSGAAGEAVAAEMSKAGQTVTRDAQGRVVLKGAVPALEAIENEKRAIEAINQAA